MDARLQRRIQRYGWDKAASFYEQYWARQLDRAQARVLSLAELRAGEDVLDVACGTGLVTLPAAACVGPRGRVVATDISDAMVAHLRDAAVRGGLMQITCQRSDAEELEVAAATFDVALCAFGLMYVTDPVRALARVYHALRPNGRVVIAVWGARTHCGWAEIFPIVERRVASEVCPLFFQLGTGDSLQYALAAARFSDIEVERITATLSYESAESACGAAFAGGPVALAYSRFDMPTRTEVHEEYLASIAAYRRGAGYDIPGEFVIARARACNGARAE
jgi:ubiquinone/menaquinone biosynthesis C-methylase UbiE